jgi:peptidylprolyl isomerase
MRRRVLAVAGGLTMAGLLAGCGAGTDAAQPSRTVPVPTTVGPTCTPTEPMTIEAGKPTVTVPEGEAPPELVSTDITVGDGPVAAVGDTVQMQYVGVSYATGEEFDSSWSRDAEPFEVTLGQGAVIPGWDQGIPGMAVGGRRQLVIPPNLAYGETGSAPKIGPNETLVFVVDLVQVCKPAGAPTGTSVPGTTPGTVVEEITTETTMVTESTTTVAGETTTTTAAETTTTTAAG